MTSIKISEMTIKQLGVSLIDLAMKQGISFILICLLAFISFSRMEKMEQKREEDTVKHSAELNRIYSELFVEQVKAITASTHALQQNTEVMEEVKNILARKK